MKTKNSNGINVNPVSSSRFVVFLAYTISSILYFSNMYDASAATVTIQVDISRSGDIALSPSSVTVANGDGVRWRINSNIPGAADAVNTGFRKWGHIRENYSATNDPLGLTQNINRHSWIAQNTTTATVGGPLVWPTGINSYSYTFIFEKPAIGVLPRLSGRATGSLNRNPNNGVSSVVVQGNAQPIVKRDRRGKFWETSLDPFPPTIVLAPKRVIDQAAMTADPLQNANGWTFVNGPSLPGDFYITKYSAYPSTRSENTGASNEVCETSINSPLDNCFTVKWVSRDPAADNKNLHWVQVICTNKPGGEQRFRCPPVDGDSWTLDRAPANTANPRDPLPVYNTIAVMTNNTSRPGDSPKVLTFRDRPARNFPPPRDAVQNVTWLAHLYIAHLDRATKTATLHDGIEWGFKIRCQGNTADRTVYRSGSAARNHPDNLVDYVVVEGDGGHGCPADFGDAPDSGVSTGYPSVLSQSGQFPTLAENAGANTQGSTISFGPKVSLERDANDPEDPDGEPNIDADAELSNRDDDEDTPIRFNLLITSIPPPAVMSIDVSSTDVEPKDMYFNLLIDLTGDGKWEGRGANGEQEWAVQNFRQTIYPGENELVTPVFPYSDGLRLPPCPWLRAAITNTPVVAEDALGWRGTGDFSYGEIEDFMLVVFPESCKVKYHSTESGIPGIDLPPLTDPKIPRIDCSPTPKIFAEGENTIGFTCNITNLGKSGNINWTLTRHTGGVVVDTVQGVTWVDKGQTIAENFTAFRGDLPSSWTARTVDPAPTSLAGVAVIGFDESISSFGFAGTDHALLVFGEIVSLREFTLVSVNEICTEPHYTSDAGFVTSYSGKKIVNPDTKGCGYGKLSSLPLHNVHFTAEDIVDSDFDGVPDEFEEMLETDALLADTNRDGILDGEEDFDVDGRTNAEEINDTNTDPLESNEFVAQVNLNERQYGSVKDEVGDHLKNYENYFDIVDVTMESDIAVDDINTTITIGDQHPSVGMINMQLKFLFNSDGRLDTGGDDGEFLGIDDEVVILIQGDQSIAPLNISAHIVNRLSGDLTPLFEPQLEKAKGSTEISLNIPESKLAMTAFDIPVFVISTELAGGTIADQTSLVFDRNKYLENNEKIKVKENIRQTYRGYVFLAIILALLGLGYVVFRKLRHDLR